MSNRYTFLDIYKNDLDLNKDTKVKNQSNSYP